MNKLTLLGLGLAAAAFSNAQIATFSDTGTGLGFAVVDDDVTDFTFTTSGLSGSITQVEIYMNPAHTYIGDLGFDVISPSGQTVSLLWLPGLSAPNDGGSGRDLISMFFADTGVDSDLVGSSSLGAINSAVSGTVYQTTDAITTGAVALSAVTSLNGTWTLRAWDTFAGDTGTVDRIVFRAFNPVPEPASMAALGLGAVALLKRRKSK
jgi:subtilisin-like proprotein convertase family protein